MRIRNFTGAVLSILIIGTCSAAVVAAGTQALSKGNIRQSAAAKIAKTSAADMKPAQPVLAD